MKRVLFLCTENACRSQMAEGWFRKLYRGGNWSASSAGTKPAKEVNPMAVEAMAEAGVDISRQEPKMLDVNQAFSAEKVVTMGCIRGCPITPLDRTIEWGIEDPGGGKIDKFRQVRDIIREKVSSLIAGLKD